VLALNSGSSSLKFGLYRVGAAASHCLLSGEAENIGEATALFHAEDGQGCELLRETQAVPDGRAALVRVIRLLGGGAHPAPQAIGHRIVHGGPALRAHCLIDTQVLQQLQACTGFAPLHTPAALAVIRQAGESFPGLPQVACLDTCFHARMPPEASTLALPRALREAGLRRYGFHGLSCESIVRQFGTAVPRRLIIAHLGNGASITAVQDGISIDTSMGLTPTGGLIMGTRSGDLDPGVLLHLMRERSWGHAAIEVLVDHQSGLLGISGLSSDMRTLHAAAGSNPQAALAITMFCQAAAKTIGAMATVLGGVDALVFTGGIGEHDAEVRAAIGTRLSCFGIELDAALNRQHCGAISTAASRGVVRVITSQEDEQIARHTRALS
jgi:acetate kinase